MVSGRFPPVDVMKALLDAGADLKLTSDDGTKPLMVAAGLGRCTFNPNIKRGPRSPSAPKRRSRSCSTPAPTSTP